jgi:hypothetical protein
VALSLCISNVEKLWNTPDRQVELEALRGFVEYETKGQAGKGWEALAASEETQEDQEGEAVRPLTLTDMDHLQMLPTWQARIDSLLQRVKVLEELPDQVTDLQRRVEALERDLDVARRRGDLGPEPRGLLERDAEESRRRSSSYNSIRGIYAQRPPRP